MKMDAWKSISISIHTLHTEGDTLTIHYMDDTDISIHTLHTEGDLAMRGYDTTQIISIHTLHTEGDQIGDRNLYVHYHFNPHPPHGG